MTSNEDIIDATRRWVEKAVIGLDLCPFAGTQPDDIENYTNRSPYPTLHLLREESVERVLRGLSDPASIYENNILRLRELGPAGWHALWTEGDL